MENRFDRKENQSQYFHLNRTLETVGSTLKGITFEVNKGYPQVKISFDRADGSYEPGMRLFFRNELTEEDLKFLKDAKITDADLAWGVYVEKVTVTDAETGVVKTVEEARVAQKPSILGLVVNGKPWQPSGEKRQYNG